MTTVSPEAVRQVVAQVVQAALAQAGAPASDRSAPGSGDGIFADMDAAISAANAAYRAYLDCSLKERARFVQVIRDVALKPEHLEYMARATVEETGMGNVADKIEKNRAAATFTPGTEDLTTQAWSGDDGLTTVEISPYGVIGAITPTTARPRR